MKSEPAGEQRLCLCDPPFEGRAILHLRFGGRCLSAEIAQCTHFIPTDLIQRAQCPHFVPINLLTLGCLGQADSGTTPGRGNQSKKMCLSSFQRLGQPGCRALLLYQLKLSTSNCHKDDARHFQTRAGV